MRNILAFKLILGFGILAAWLIPVAAAETEYTPAYQAKPEIQVTESSKPVFDLDLFKDKPPKVDPFFKELQEDLGEFSTKQHKRRLKFLEKVREKEMDSEERQDKIINFNREEREKLEKFHDKQRNKIKKYHEKKG